MTDEKIQLIALIIASISALAAAVSAIYSAKSSRLTLELYKKDKEEKLLDELNRILEIAIEYPYLESQGFTSKWNEYRMSDDERYLRYDMYCNLLFNYLHHVFEHFDKNKEKVENFVDVKSRVRMHKQSWQNPMDESGNVDGYDEPFRNFINSYIF